MSKAATREETDKKLAAVITEMMEAPDIEDQKSALYRFEETSDQIDDKEFVVEHLVNSLEKTELGAPRTWLISALGRVNSPGTIDILAKYLDPAFETSERVVTGPS